jgi:hypothetical protein
LLVSSLGEWRTNARVGAGRPDEFTRRGALPCVGSCGSGAWGSSALPPVAAPHQAWNFRDAGFVVQKKPEEFGSMRVWILFVCGWTGV